MDLLVLSPLHEIVVELLRRSPELLRPLLGDRLDALARDDLSFDTDHTRAPQLIDVDSDLVLKLRDREGTLLCALITEVQLEKKGSKHRTWPLYAAWTHYRLDCPVYVVVFAPDEALARWAAGPFRIGDMVLRPYVIGPEQLRPITTFEQAREAVELTFLSGVAHRDEPVALDIGLSLRRALDVSDHELGELMWDIYLGSIGDPIRKALEMELRNYKPMSDWGKRIYAKGEQEGEAKGRQEGEAKGRQEGEAKALLVLLSARRIRITRAQRQRIRSCREPRRLETWLRRAATATTVAEVFDDDA